MLLINGIGGFREEKSPIWREYPTEDFQTDTRKSSSLRCRSMSSSCSRLSPFGQFLNAYHIISPKQTTHWLSNRTLVVQMPRPVRSVKLSWRSGSVRTASCPCSVHHRHLARSRLVLQVETSYVLFAVGILSGLSLGYYRRQFTYRRFCLLGVPFSSSHPFSWIEKCNKSAGAVQTRY